MSMIRITIRTDNAAFGIDGEHDNPEGRARQDAMSVGCEVARILRRMADQFEGDGEATNPRDINGNQVGAVETIEQETDR
jgi:hypothetical protein